MDELERQVSVGLRELVKDPVQSPPIFDRVANEVRRRQRFRLAGIAMAVAVVLAALTIGGLQLSGRGDDLPPTAVMAAACPGKDTGLPSNPQRSDLSTELVPGKPAAATVCRYHGFNQPEPFRTLARSATVPGTDVAALAATLNGGERIPEGTVDNCPGRSAGSVRVIFKYRSGEAVTIWIDLGGCRIAWNGKARVFTSQPAQQRLTDLVGADPS